MALELDLGGITMSSNHPGVQVTGQPIDRFPRVSFGLCIHEETLLPIQRDLLRDADGESYWDLSLSPGRVWSEPDDDKWSRASLPFQLSNIFENDSHHGVACFLFRDGEISPIFFQITAETKAFLCPENLQAWGWLTASIAPLAESSINDTIAAFRDELADQHPIRPLADWHSAETQSLFTDLATGYGADTTLTQGLVIDGNIHASPCVTPRGNYPYPRAMKFGIWSATKSAFCSIACLRIAQIGDADPRQAKVAELLHEARDNPDWQDITIGDCLNMASGIGTINPSPEPPDAFADYLIEECYASESGDILESYTRYHEWFLAPDQHSKNKAAFACRAYPWPAGQVMRYRDQDLYIAGAALDAVLKKLRGPQAHIWDMVRDEVYAPAGVHHAIKFETIETDPAKRVPLSDAGLLLSMDNLAALGQLIHDGGRVGDKQILHPHMLDEFFDPRRSKGLPTGLQTADGDVHYHAGIWHLPYRSAAGELLWIPSMRGYGGQIIQTLPNGMTAFRFGFDSYETEERYDALKLVRLADAIRPF